MKRVTFTFSMDFEDHITNECCVQCAIEVVSQDRNWPSDEDIKIESIPEDEQ